MTDTYTQLQDLNIITPAGQVNKQARRMLQKHPMVEQAIMDETSFLYTDADVVTRIRCMIEGIDTQPVCIQCGRPLVPLRYKHNAQRFVYMCQNTTGRSCATANPGVVAAREQTLLDRYGVTNPSQHGGIREKTVATNRLRYGGVAPACSPAVVDKARATMSAKPQAEIDDIIARRRSTMVQHHGAFTHAQSIMSPDVLQRIHQYSYDPEWLYDQHITQGKTLTDIADFIGVTTTVISQRFKRLGVGVVRHPNISTRSTGEQELLEFIKNTLGDDIEVVTNDRTVIAPQELDIFIPRYNIAFEFCGVYWHSEGRGRTRLYHNTKTINCAANGVRLIQIWSTEWNSRQELVRSRIRNILKKNTGVVYARKCTVLPISTTAADKFIDATHIQGKHSAPINYGLFEGGVRLVAVMSFGRDRFSTMDRYELVRFATIGDSNVVGGASKLLRAFINQHPPKPIVSYSDRRWNTGRVYKQLGFEYSHTSTPNYFYFDKLGDTNKLLSRHNFQKHKLSSKLEMFDPNLTEWENMVINGYDRIWDCGNDVFVWNAPV